MKFMAGVRKMPILWQLWLVLLMMINGVGPLFFLSESVAVVALVAVISGGIIGVVLCETHGFTKILGVMHGPWVALLALQLLVLREGVAAGGFRNWLLASTTVTLVSLIIDAVDVVSYLKGNRTDLLA